MSTLGNKLVVAAIDFGTTYSGYAFSLRHEYEKDPLCIKINPKWEAGGRCLISHKAPTTVLLNPKKEFHSFGYDAENKFSELSLDCEHNDWYYFRRFKMELYKQKVSIIIYLYYFVFNYVDMNKHVLVCVKNYNIQMHIKLYIYRRSVFLSGPDYPRD